MIRTLKLFVVGPHDAERYDLVRNYIQRVIGGRTDRGQLAVSIVTPVDNPSADLFNDWIFGQIDSCDLLVADMTGFNPNVIYEVAFAHTLGVPCAYLRFEKSAVGQLTQIDQDKIEHYFKFSLIPTVTVNDLRAGRSKGFDLQLESVLSGAPASGSTILSEYYQGVSPVDAEFVRGLAEGYYRNYLGPLLTCELPEEYEGYGLRVLIPDTFELPDAEVRRSAQNLLGKQRTKLASNSLKRELDVSHPYEEAMQGVPFFFDIPTTLLTITESSKYRKALRADYFNALDRDRVTDRLARKFVAALWAIIAGNRSTIEWPLDDFEIVWLSETIGAWSDNERLMNTDALARPDWAPPPRRTRERG